MKDGSSNGGASKPSPNMSAAKTMPIKGLEKGRAHPAAADKTGGSTGNPSSAGGGKAGEKHFPRSATQD